MPAPTNAMVFVPDKFIVPKFVTVVLEFALIIVIVFEVADKFLPAATEIPEHKASAVTFEML